MRVLKVMAALLDVAAAREAAPQLPAVSEPEPRLAQVAFRPVDSEPPIASARRVSSLEHAEPALAAAYPTQAARAAMLDRFLVPEPASGRAARVGATTGR